MIDLIGWIGTFLLITCALPQVYQTYKTRVVDGLSLSMLIMWAVGCYCMLIYEAFTTYKIPLILNYAICSIFALYLAVCVIRFRKK